MKILRLTTCLGSLVLLCACSEEPAPISVTEFIEQPRLLEATMIRCAQNRAESRYLVECINARDAVNRIEARQERVSREELEQQSERKRQALRRTQQAAAEARRRTLEAQRLREEREYLGLFDGTTENTATNSGVEPALTGSADSNAPGTVVEDSIESVEESPLPEQTPSAPETDLGAIRDELRRRQQSNNQD